MVFHISGELKSQGVPKANPIWCLFYRVGRVGPAVGQVDGRDQRAWIHAWDGSLPFLLWNSSRTIKAAAYHIWVLPSEFARGQLLEPLSARCCIQMGSLEEGLRKGPSFFALKNHSLFCFYIAKASYWMLGKQDDWVISRMWSAPCKVKLDFYPHFLSGFVSINIISTVLGSSKIPCQLNMFKILCLSC